jgi:hypothetical protein
MVQIQLTLNYRKNNKINRLECKTNQQLILELTLDGVRGWSFPNYLLKITLMNIAKRN